MKGMLRPASIPICSCSNQGRGQKRPPPGVWVDSRRHPTVQKTDATESFRLCAYHAGDDSSGPHYASVAKLADARDLGSRG